MKGAFAPSLPEFSADYFQLPAQQNTPGKALFGNMAGSGALPKISYGFRQGVVNSGNFDLFRSQLMQAGYPEEQIVAEAYATFPDFLNSTYEGKHQISLVGWTLSYPDVENNLQLFYGPNRSPGANLGNYENSRYDELFERVRNLEPSIERTALVKEMSDLLWEDCAFFSSLGLFTPMLVNHEVIGEPDRSQIMNGRYFQYLKVESRPDN